MKDGYGTSHAEYKHLEDVPFIPRTLVKGKIYQHEEPNKLYVVHGDHVAVLRAKPRNDGGVSKTRYGLVTHFKDRETAQRAKARAVPKIEGRWS